MKCLPNENGDRDDESYGTDSISSVEHCAKWSLFYLKWF
jgi:hypothetical protein